MDISSFNFQNLSDSEDIVPVNMFRLIKSTVDSLGIVEVELGGVSDSILLLSHFITLQQCLSA